MSQTSRNWPVLRIGEVGDVFTGRTPPTERSSYFGNDFPFITPGDMRQGKYARETQRSLSQEGAELLKRIKLPAKSVCVSCIGWQMGEVVLTDRPSFSNQQINTIVPNDEVDASFLYYSLRTRKQELLSLGSATGVRTPILNKSAFCDTKLVVPPLPVQQRIAGILSAYDELIENSQRRIKILEAMARGLYREWFVHFRFPGHENHPRVASALGEIPKGWEVKKLKDVCRLTMGQSPKSEFYNEVGDGVPFHQGVTDFGARFPTDRLFCTAAGRITEAGDILFSVRAPVGRMNIANKKIILGRGLSAIRYNEGSQAFLWEQLRNRFTKDDMMGNGAIFASVTKDDMQGIGLVCPTQSVVEAATKHFEPLHSEIATLSQQIQNLRRTRDLLLPRLLSGQIDIGEI